MAAVELLVRPGRKAALQPGAEGLGRLLGRISGLSPMRHDVGAPQRRRDGERHEHEHADDDESEMPAPPNSSHAATTNQINNPAAALWTDGWS